MLAFRILVGAVCLLVSAAPVLAQSGRNVLVVVNNAVSGSADVAERYAAARGVPAEQIVRLDAGTNESISRVDFEQKVRKPIADHLAARSLQDQILYIVLTRGVPLKVTGTTGRQGTLASVDSELTLLYRRMTGGLAAPGGSIPNPYFLGNRDPKDARPFSRGEHDIYLVTRLDGFTIEDALTLIDRGSTSGATGTIVLDDVPLLRDPRNKWLAAAAERLTAAGLGERTVHDATSRSVTDLSNVLGYASWGSNDRAYPGRAPRLTFGSGAIASLFVSADARTFAEPPSTWTPGAAGRNMFAGSNSALLGDLVRAGVTGAAGQIDEPFLDGSVRPDILFPAYLQGRNLAEAFYLAIPALSWQTVVIGDPFAAPFDSDPRVVPEVAIDPETGYPGHFSARRLAGLTDVKTYGSSPAVRKLLLRAESAAARGETQAAVAALSQAVALEPDAVGGWRVLGQLEETAGRYDAAAAAYLRVLALDPDDITALNNLAFHRAVRQQSPETALPLATRASTLARANPMVDDTLGWIHHLLGNDREALPFMDRASRALPGDAEVQLRAAVVYAAIGRLTDAARSLEAAAAAAPSVRERAEFLEVQKKLGRR